MRELTYRYLASSTVVGVPRDHAVLLATAGGRSANPAFFSGFSHQPALTARAILTVAEVARTRYFDPGAANRSRDPVVTSNMDVLRFESLSACNGVYARFDLDREALDGTFLSWGTTNVDLNSQMRNALAGIADAEPLRLTVGSDELTVDTLDGTVVERRVPLPDRWVRGFAEVSVAAGGMLLLHDVSAGPARRILRELPRLRAKRPGWVTWTSRGARLTSAPDDEAVHVAGPNRLGSVRRLIPLLRGLRVYAPPPAHRAGVGGRAGTQRMAQPSAWELVFDGARLVLMLSPEVYRGFSGEGGVLRALAQTGSNDLVAAARILHGQSTIDVGAIADELAVDADTASSVIHALGGAGRVGFDLSSGGFFHRDLPFDRGALDELQPRLIDARALVAASAVAFDGDGASVRSGDARYVVRFDSQISRCTCPWFAKHRGERGPCKHVLAAELARAGVHA